MSPGAKRILEELAADEECDLVQEGNQAYCGNRRTAVRTINQLLGLMAISILSQDGFRSAFTIYGINDIGRSLLRRPELETELMLAIYAEKRKPFHVINDKLEFLPEPTP